MSDEPEETLHPPTSVVQVVTLKDDMTLPKIPDINLNRLKDLVKLHSINSVIEIVKVTMEIVENANNASNKGDYAIELITALCKDNEIINESLGKTLTDLLENGLIKDTMTLVVHASKGGLSLNKIVELGTDAVKIIEDIANTKDVVNETKTILAFLCPCLKPKINT